MRQKISIFLILSVWLLCSSCGNRATNVPSGWDSIPQAYAQLLSLYQKDGIRLAIVRNPWKRGAELHRYILVPRDMEVPSDLPSGTVIRVPLQRVCSFTSVHSYLLCELGAVAQMAGVCDAEYVRSPKVLAHLQSHELIDMGSALQPNIERILSEKCDGLLVSPFEESGYGALEKAGVPLIECADYMETSALGRAEWVRFFGMLMGKEHEADSLFQSVEKHYNDLCQLITPDLEKPKLMNDLLNGSAWFVPGGQSTLGRLYNDAGADYLFGDNAQKGSLRLSFESVLQRASDADVWLIKYGRSSDHTYASLLEEQPRYERFKPFQNQNIYGCNTFKVPFFDEEPFHPDYLLADAIKIFHPELLPDWQLHYFFPLQ